jgi:hypothetical protein
MTHYTSLNVIIFKKFFYIIAHESQSVVFKTVFPDKSCKNGGQIIFIQLKELVKKCGM